MSRKLVYDVNVLTGTCKVYYDGDDGSEALMETPDEEFADAIVEAWNEAIDEDESLQKTVDYKHTCVKLSAEEIEELQVRVEGLAELLNDSNARNVELAAKLKRAEQEEGRLRQKLGNLEADVRCFLDELPYDEDTALTRQLRRHVWNDDDTRQRRQWYPESKTKGGEE